MENMPLHYSFSRLPMAIFTYTLLAHLGCKKPQKYDPDKGITVTLKSVRLLGPDSAIVELHFAGSIHNMVEYGVCWTSQNRAPFTTDYFATPNLAGRENATMIVTCLGGGEKIQFRGYAVKEDSKTIYSETITIEPPLPVRSNGIRKGNSDRCDVHKHLQFGPARIAVISYDSEKEYPQADITIFDTAMRQLWARALPVRRDISQIDAQVVGDKIIIVENASLQFGDDYVQLHLSCYTFDGKWLWTRPLRREGLKNYYGSAAVGDLSINIFYHNYLYSTDSVAIDVVDTSGNLLTTAAWPANAARWLSTGMSLAACMPSGELVLVERNSYYITANPGLIKYGPSGLAWSSLLDDHSYKETKLAARLAGDEIVIISTIRTNRTQGAGGLTLALVPAGEKKPNREITYYNSRHAGRLTTLDPSSVTRTRNGDLLVAATIKSPVQQYPLLARFDSKGRLKWHYVPTTGLDYMVQAHAAWEQADGSILLTGTTANSPFCVTVAENR